MRIVIIIIVSILNVVICFGQGRYAGSKSSLIGKAYEDSRNIEGLEGWEFQSGTVISPFDDPELMIACVFKKGNSLLCFYSIKEDTTSENYKIMDVLLVKNILKGWQLYTASCRQTKIENVEIVALVKWSPSQQYLKPAKQAWRFNRDKRRFEVISTKDIDCINEGLE